MQVLLCSAWSLWLVSQQRHWGLESQYSNNNVLPPKLDSALKGKTQATVKPGVPG